MKQISFKLEIFEGPLDLLLHLISKNKVSLYDIPISDITEQYMDYLSEMKHFDIEVSSEFLVVAANLLYIKSKMLLPKYEGEQEEDDPRTELARRLEEYKRFKEAAVYLMEREAAGSHTFYKMREYIEPRLIDESLTDITVKHLVDAMAEIADKLRYRLPIKAKTFKGLVGREIISVFSKVKAVLKSLSNLKKIRFSDIFKGVKSRDEAVASFLAVLELIKMNRVKVVNSDEGVVLKYVKNTKEGALSFGDSQD
ncbi:MAG: Segregation and condensation protein A [Firmicutes bacterium ADurb.Bin193]|nr:MAG: Segregation and condensation protein A [Firmicutes bacterium ADurb.Bin193]